jgi:ATP-dependent DNA ligase
VSPILAKAALDIPPNMHHEGKWGSFRTIVFRGGDEVELGSCNEQPMTRHFPGLVESLKANLPKRYVVDGEIVIV